jgi:hypothetical protein
LNKQGCPLQPASFEQNVTKLADFITTISPISRRTTIEDEPPLKFQFTPRLGDEFEVPIHQPLATVESD